MGKALLKVTLPLSIGLLLLASFLAMTREGRTTVKSVLLISHFLPFSPVRPLKWFSRPPIRESVTYHCDSTAIKATLYRPSGEGRYGAIVFSLGVTPNYEDPLLLSLVDGLARVGVAVLVPESPYLSRGLLAPEEVDSLVAAFQFMREQPFVDPDRLGFGGFCVGASLATLAAEDERINDQVVFVSFFGGYYDPLEVMKAAIGERIRYDGIEEPWQPHPLTREVFISHLIGALESPEDRATLRKIFLEGGEASEGELARLSPLAREVYKLLKEKEPERLDALLPLFPKGALKQLLSLSLQPGLKNLRAEMFIMHDRNDSYIPYTESRRLVAESPPSVTVHFNEFVLFEHMYPSRPLDFLTLLRELFKLYRHLWGILYLLTE